MIYPNSNWWVGVIEDRKDPEKMGRCKVRIYGYHPPDKKELSTDDLPWAMLMTPATSASISGVGTSPVGILEGSWVVGFFMDGDDAQQPIIVGTVPGRPEEKEKDNTGDQASSQGGGGRPSNNRPADNNTLKNNFGETVRDGSGNPIQVGKQSTDSSPREITNLRSVKGSLPPLTAQDVSTILDTLQQNKNPGGIR